LGSRTLAILLDDKPESLQRVEHPQHLILIKILERRDVSPQQIAGDLQPFHPVQPQFIS
jgi:hypothetical protein